MSCQIRVTAFISEIPEIRRCLFPTDDNRGSDSWLQNCSISIAPTGDVIALAKDRRLVILTAKWDSETSSTNYHTTFAGTVHESDNIKTVLALPIVTLTKSSHVSPDWTCIVVGFESGFMRIYTENCDLLLEEQFHNECITSIKCQSQYGPRPDISNELQVEELYIQYQSNICILSGSQLYPALRNSRAQLARVQANSELLDLPSPSFNIRKWAFQDQASILDTSVVGLAACNSFDHLLVASTSGGFDSKYRTTPPNNTLVLTAGSKPFLGFHYATEGGAQPVLSDVAKAMAHKLKSALPGWLTGTKTEPVKLQTIALQPADQMGCRFGLCDLRRNGESVILSPGHKLAVVADNLGRVCLIDTQKGIATRILKGYRKAQCAFIQVPDERKNRHRHGDKVALFLVIYSPQKGTIEIFTTQHLQRIAAFSASKHSTLLYINYGLVGFQQGSNKSRYVCQYGAVLIDNNGMIKDFAIPFHFSLSAKDTRRARDVHLYKKLREIIKSDNLDLNTLEENVLNICQEIVTLELKSQLVELLITSKCISIDLALKSTKYLLENLQPDIENEALKIKLTNITTLLEFYSFVQKDDDKFDPGKNGNNNMEDQGENLTEKSNINTNGTVFHLDAKELQDLQRLLDLSISKGKEVSTLKVTFSDLSEFSVCEFLSAFILTEDNSIKLKNNLEDNLVLKLAEILFANCVEKNVKYALFQEKAMQSKIPSKDLFYLLIHYWVNRPYLTFDLEKQMSNFANILYVLAKITKLTLEEDENLVSFWGEVRKMLSNSSRPFPALTASMLCRHVALHMESEAEDDPMIAEEAIVILSEESCEWGLLIGKLEDISLLEIIISNKIDIKASPLPKLKHEKVQVSLKFVLEKKGSVSELVSHWLTGTGMDPKYIVINDWLYRMSNDDNKEEDDERQVPEDDVQFVKTQELFHKLNLIRAQFPYSAASDPLLANMAWEYSAAWRKNPSDLNLLEACMKCIGQIPNDCIRLGLHGLIWSSYICPMFEVSAKLLSKAGRLPKERLCEQNTGLSDDQLTLFITVCTDFLDIFTDLVQDMYVKTRPIINFEPLWEDGGQPLIELAAHQTDFNYDLLQVHYQLALVFQMLCVFSLKQSKPIQSLFSPEVVPCFFIDLHLKTDVDFGQTDSKIRSNRLQYLHKCISASVETVVAGTSADDHLRWASKCELLAQLWGTDVDSVRRKKAVKLFQHGHNVLGDEAVGSIKDLPSLGVDLLTVAGRRLEQYVSAAEDLGVRQAALSPTLSRYLETLDGEWCASSSLEELISLTTIIITCLDDSIPEYKIALLLLEACTNLKEIEDAAVTQQSNS